MKGINPEPRVIPREWRKFVYTPSGEKLAVDVKVA